MIFFHKRRLRSAYLGETLVEVAYHDEPATTATWDRGADAIAAETGIFIEDVHLELMRCFPKEYGL